MNIITLKFLKVKQGLQIMSSHFITKQQCVPRLVVLQTQSCDRQTGYCLVVKYGLAVNNKQTEEHFQE